MYICSEKENFKRRMIIAIFIFYMAYLFFGYTAAAVVLGTITERHVEYYPDAENILSGTMTHDEVGLESKEVFLKTDDGETVWCAVTVPPSPKGAVIHLSGMMNPSATLFYGHSALLHKNGYASIILEMRAHGSSSGGRISLGYREHLDVKAVLEYIESDKQLCDIPIVIHGVSMGGATAINAFGLYDDIDACIAMSPYASFEKQAQLWATQWSGVLMPFSGQIINSMLYAERVLYGDDVLTVTPYNQIQKSGGRPILLIACSGDKTVSPENSLLLKEICPDAELWMRESDEHLIVKDRDYRNVEKDTEYCERILGFLNNVCGS